MVPVFGADRLVFVCCMRKTVSTSGVLPKIPKSRTPTVFGKHRRCEFACTMFSVVLRLYCVVTNAAKQMFQKCGDTAHRARTCFTRSCSEQDASSDKHDCKCSGSESKESGMVSMSVSCRGRIPSSINDGDVEEEVFSGGHSSCCSECEEQDAKTRSIGSESCSLNVLGIPLKVYDSKVNTASTNCEPRTSSMRVAVLVALMDSVHYGKLLGR